MSVLSKGSEKKNVHKSTCMYTEVSRQAHYSKMLTFRDCGRRVYEHSYIIL